MFAKFIPVQYKSGQYALVAPQSLERLILADRLFKFKRGSGWVILGSDPVRGMGGGSYYGVDRRAPVGCVATEVFCCLRERLR